MDSITTRRSHAVEYTLFLCTFSYLERIGYRLRFNQ